MWLTVRSLLKHAWTWKESIKGNGWKKNKEVTWAQHINVPTHYTFYTFVFTEWL